MSWTLIREHIPSGGFVPDMNGLPFSDGLDVWSVTSGVWFEPGGGGFHSGVDDGVVTPTTMPNTANQKVETVLAGASNSKNDLNGRWTDSAHHYKVRWGDGATTLYVVEPSAGGGAGYAVLGSAASANLTDKVALVMAGDQISVEINDLVVIGPVTNTLLATGIANCQGGNGTGSYGYFKVYQEGGGVPPTISYPDSPVAAQEGVSVGNVDPDLVAGDPPTGAVQTSGPSLASLGLTLVAGPGGVVARLGGLPIVGSPGTHVIGITPSNSAGDGPEAFCTFEIAAPAVPTVTYPPSVVLVIGEPGQTIEPTSLTGYDVTVTAVPALPVGHSLDAASGIDTIDGDAIVLERQWTQRFYASNTDGGTSAPAVVLIKQVYDVLGTLLNADGSSSQAMTLEEAPEPPPVPVEPSPPGGCGCACPVDPDTGRVNVSTVEALALAANRGRENAVIENLGAQPVYVYFATGAGAAAPVLVPQYGRWSARRQGLIYTGAIYVKTAASTSVVGVVEETS